MLCKMGIVHYKEIGWIEDWVLVEIHPVIHNRDLHRALVGSFVRTRNVLPSAFHEDCRYTERLSFR